MFAIAKVSEKYGMHRKDLFVREYGINMPLILIQQQRIAANSHVTPNVDMTFDSL